MAVPLRFAAAIVLVPSLLTGCGMFKTRPPCAVDVTLATSNDENKTSATASVLTRRIAELAGDVTGHKRDGDRITFDVGNCPADRQLLRALLLAPGKFEIGLKDGPIWLTEADIIDSSVMPEGDGAYVAFRLTSAATASFARATSSAIGKVMQIKWDGQVLAEPRLMEAIAAGSGQVGPVKPDDAVVIASVLRTGSLPVPVRTVKITTLDGK